MANPWTWIRGVSAQPQRVKVNNNSATKIKGEACVFTSHLAVAAADGGTVDLVMAQDCTANQTAVMAILPHGDEFLVRVATGTQLYVGDDVFMAATNTVDAGAANQTNCGIVIGFDPPSGGCALIAVWSAKQHPRNYGDGDGS